MSEREVVGVCQIRADHKMQSKFLTVLTNLLSSIKFFSSQSPSLVTSPYAVVGARLFLPHAVDIPSQCVLLK